MASAAPYLQIIGVSKSYNSIQNAPPVRVLEEISLDVAQGESIAFVGPSGSGKSTLLNIIGTLDRPTSGKVLLEGRDITQLSETEVAKLRNQHLGFVFQSHNLLPQCTVLENVLVPTLALPQAKDGNQALERAHRLLTRVGLGSRSEHRPGQLSGGERQRVAVVRALINQPQLLLADEPTGALDRKSAEELSTLLVELNKEENVTLIVVTHALELAKRLHRQFQMLDGKLLAA